MINDAEEEDDGRMTFLGVGVGGSTVSKICARLASAERREMRRGWAQAPGGPRWAVAVSGDKGKVTGGS